VQKENYDIRHRTAPDLTKGDLVLVKTHPLSSAPKHFSAKLAPKRDGPYIVLSFQKPSTYILGHLPDGDHPFTCPTDQVTKYYEQYQPSQEDLQQKDNRDKISQLLLSALKSACQPTKGVVRPGTLAKSRPKTNLTESSISEKPAKIPVTEEIPETAIFGLNSASTAKIGPSIGPTAWPILVMTENLAEDSTSTNNQKPESTQLGSEQNPKSVAPAVGKFGDKIRAVKSPTTDQQPGQNKNNNNLEQITVNRNPKPLDQIPTLTQENENNPKGKLHRFRRAMKNLLGFKPSTVKIRAEPGPENLKKGSQANNKTTRR
jgi:hypothetical protein